MNKIELGLPILLLGTIIAGMKMTPPIQKLTPPQAQKIPKDVTVHQDTRIDDYYWLKERDTQPVLDYLKAENDYTFAKMKHTELLQKTLYNEMRGRIKEDDTLIATFALSDLCGATPEESVAISNYAAGRVCEEVEIGRAHV